MWIGDAFFGCANWRCAMGTMTCDWRSVLWVGSKSWRRLPCHFLFFDAWQPQLLYSCCMFAVSCFSHLCGTLLGSRGGEDVRWWNTFYAVLCFSTKVEARWNLLVLNVLVQVTVARRSTGEELHRLVNANADDSLALEWRLLPPASKKPMWSIFNQRLWRCESFRAM